MKATGIVRRIDETAIIGPSQKNLGKSMGFADLVFFFMGLGTKVSIKDQVVFVKR